MGELVALRWIDVDLDKNIIHVHSEEANQPYQNVSGKWHDRRVVFRILSHTLTEIWNYCQKP